LKNFLLNKLSDFQQALLLVQGEGSQRAWLSNQSLFQSPTGDKDTARFHSDIVDKILGFNIVSIEKELFAQARGRTPDGDLQSWGHNLHQGNQTWIGLDPQTLLTPYSELKLMCELLSPRPQEHLVDLGAGYGRMGIVLEQLFPQVKFTGLEYVSERVREGQRILAALKCNNARLYQGDLTGPDFLLPEADYYFVYDYGKVLHIRHTLKQLERMAERRRFKVIARGRGSRSIIDMEHPWLSQVFKPHHEEFFSIYSMSAQDT
jgi:SAM-dependent methyltransferase